MEAYGVEVRCGASAPSVAELKAQGYTHILFATGAWKAGRLDIEGNVAGVIAWMKEMKTRVKPTLDGNVVVVGAGNTAMDAARVAKRMGARSAILYRRTKKYMPADEHELQLAIDEGVQFIELAAPVKQADGVLVCERMKLGAPDASGRRSPEPTGETFTIPCDLVISAVGEKVDDALMAANGIEMGKKGPAFQTNVEGVWCAGDARRGPATIVEGIADAAAFAEAVTGRKHTYDIPEEAYPSRAEAAAKKGVLAMASDVCCEGERCLQCKAVCENCVDSCPNRANVAIRLRDGSHQILHVDKMCNECGNCTQFCPYASEPCRDKFTLFQTAEDMEDSKNAGVLFLGGDRARVRLYGGARDVDLSADETGLPAALEEFIFTIRDKYSYLYQ
jgi:putative selenate reductase